MQRPVECLAVLTEGMEREASRVGCVPDHMHHWARGTAAAKYRRVSSRTLISAAIPHLILTPRVYTLLSHLQGGGLGQSCIEFVPFVYVVNQLFHLRGADSYVGSDQSTCSCTGPAPPA